MGQPSKAALFLLTVLGRAPHDYIFHEFRKFKEGESKDILGAGDAVWGRGPGFHPQNHLKTETDRDRNSKSDRNGRD